MKKQNLQSKSVRKGLGTTKVVFSLSTAPPNVGVTKEKHVFIIITRVFLHSTRSARVRSIALKVCSSTLESLSSCRMALSYGTRVTADMGMRSIVAACARVQMPSITALVCLIALPGNSYILLFIFHLLTAFLCQ